MHVGRANSADRARAGDERVDYRYRFVPVHIVVRRAKQTELAGLVSIEAAADTLFPAGRVNPGDTLSVSDHRRFLLDGVLLVAAVNGVVTGFAACKCRPRGLHMSVLAVHRDHMRQGIGTRLVRSVIAEADARSLAQITLTTFEDLPFNAPFYATFGFRKLSGRELDDELKAYLDWECAAGMTQRVAMVLRTRKGLD